MTDRQGELQLKRLGTLSDVVFGLVILRFFDTIPKPVMGSFEWSDLADYFSENLFVLLVAVIGILVTTIYWTQNNMLSSQLKRTDGRHTGFSIFQLFFLLIFLYSLKFGIDNGASPLSRGFESIAATCVGLFAGLGFSYAIKKRRLLLDEVSDEDARLTSIRILAEPITALFTLFFIFTPILWEISWLSYPLIVLLLKKGKK